MYSKYTNTSLVEHPPGGGVVQMGKLEKNTNNAECFASPHVQYQCLPSSPYLARASRGACAEL